jgi:uncharacterized membrane protein
MLTVWVFIHLMGVLGFLAAHGTSTAVALRLRAVRDRDQVRALLDLSRSTRPVNDVSLLLLLVGGIAAAVQGHLWTQAWLDVSLGLFVGLAALGVPILVRHFRRVRVALGSGDDAALETLLRSNVPAAFAVVGGLLILFILWLMVAKPF